MNTLTCVNAPVEWVGGVAEVVTESRDSVIVRCPHCGERHRHTETVRGSGQVLAGCHVGHGRCRTYAVPGEPRRRRPRWAES